MLNDISPVNPEGCGVQFVWIFEDFSDIGIISIARPCLGDVAMISLRFSLTVSLFFFLQSG